MSRRRKITLASILVLGVVGGLLLLSRDLPQTRRLADGTEISLSRVIVGTNAEFRHGTSAEKFLGDLIPAGGVKILRANLQRPSTRSFDFDTPMLVAVFQASTNLVLRRPRHPRSQRFLVSGEDSFGYVAEVSDFVRERDGYFNYLLMESFPRASRTLEFRSQEKYEDGWRDLARFTVRNPRRVNARSDWPDAQPLPAVEQVDDLEVELSRITIDPASKEFQNDIWQTAVTFHWRIRRGDQILTNWAARDLQVEDALGNRTWMTGRLTHTNGTSRNLYWRSLDPRQVWRIEAEFGPASDFASTSIFHLAAPPDLTTEMITNVNDHQFSISRSEDELTIRLLDEMEEKRLTFLNARLADGTMLRSMGGNWDQFHWRTINLARVDAEGMLHMGDLPPQDVILSFAVHENVPVQFLSRPMPLTAAENP